MDAAQQHYQSPDLLDRIIDGLSQSELPQGALTESDLSPVDEFHFSGAEATAELIELLNPQAGMHILDAGAGLGGPARHLAEQRDCRVTGVDLSQDYCDVGNAMSDWVGLQDKVSLAVGDVTNLHQYPVAHFDGAWTIHVGMNIADKNTFYKEVSRVLKPNAPFVLYDVVLAGDASVVQYPLPWATRADDSYVAPLAEVTDSLQRAGFDVNHHSDHSQQSIDFIEASITRVMDLGGQPPLGLHLVLGEAFPHMIGNMHGNLSQGLLNVVSLQCTKRA